MDRIIAFSLGFVCFICTLIILFGHVRSVDDLTVIHLYILVSFIVSVGAGYYMWHAGVGNAIAFGLIFVVATGVCVGLSGSRSFSSLEKKIDESDRHNKRRDALIARHDTAATALAAAQHAVDEYAAAITKSVERAADQCATGRGSRCTGQATGVELRREREKQLTDKRDSARDAFNTLAAELKRTPPMVANEELRPLAMLYSTLTGTPVAASMHVVIMILAYSLAILTEFSGVTFMNYALHTPAPIARAASTPPLAATPASTPISHAHVTHTHVTPTGSIPLADIARQLNLDPRIARKKVRELGIQKPVQGWSFPTDVADDIKKRLSLTS